jgi:hypothetical protein
MKTVWHNITALAAVQSEVAKSQEFVEEWLQVIEEPKPTPRLVPEQRQLSKQLEKTIGDFRGLGLPNESIKAVLRELLPIWVWAFKDLTREQMKYVVSDVISNL